MVEVGKGTNTMDRLTAGWLAIEASAIHWDAGTQDGIFNNTLFASSLQHPETYLFIVVSKKQRQALKHASVRRRLTRLNDAFLRETSESFQVLDLNRPFISMVRESRVNQLHRWAGQREFTLE